MKSLWQLSLDISPPLPEIVDFNVKVAASEEAARILTSKAQPLTTVELLLELSEADVLQRKELVEEAQKEVDERIKICRGLWGRFDAFHVFSPFFSWEMDGELMENGWKSLDFR